MPLRALAARSAFTSSSEARVFQPLTSITQVKAGKAVTETQSRTLAQTLSCTSPTDPDVAHLAAAWPGLPPHVQAAISALVATAKPLPTADTFDAAFERLDRATGSHNFVSLVDLRRAMPWDRATFDAELKRQRRAGRYTLAAAEGRHGVTAEEREAGILEGGTLLLYVLRRAT